MLLENNPYPFDPRVRREAEALVDAGYWIGVVAPRDRGQPAREVIRGVEVYRFPRPPSGPGLLTFIWEYAVSTLLMSVYAVTIWIKRRYRVLHAHNPPDTMWAVGLLLKVVGVRFIYDHHDLSAALYVTRFGRRKPDPVHAVLKLLEKASCRTANAILTTNGSYRRIDAEEHGADPGKIFVVRNGPTDDFATVEPDPELAARAPHIVGYIGTMGPQDGVDYLLRATKHLRDSLGRTDFHVVIIGGGESLKLLRELATELGVDDLVTLTGRISAEAVLRYLSTATICVQPDPLGPLNDFSTMNKIMEYMALGKPIVAFDLFETKYSAGESALYATPNDELDFARKIVDLMDDPLRAARMGAAGRMRIQEELSWRHSVPHLLAAYESLQPPGSAPR